MKKNILILGVLAVTLLSQLMVPSESASPISITDVQTNWEACKGIFEGQYRLDSVDITIENKGNSGWQLYRYGIAVKNEEGLQIEYWELPLVPPKAFGPPEYIYINPGETKKIHVDGTTYCYSPGRYSVKIILSHTPRSIHSPQIKKSDVAATYERSVHVGGIGVPGFEALFAIVGLLTITYLLRRRK